MYVREKKGTEISDLQSHSVCNVHASILSDRELRLSCFRDVSDATCTDNYDRQVRNSTRGMVEDSNWHLRYLFRLAVFERTLLSRSSHVLSALVTISPCYGMLAVSTRKYLPTVRLRFGCRQDR